MAAAIYNFFIEQGSFFEITFQYLDVNSNPIDLTNYCIRLRMKDNTNVVRIYGSEVACNNYTLSKSSDGFITWSLPASVTKDFTFTSAVYDLDVNSDSIDSRRISTGRIEIIPNNFVDCIGGNPSRICAPCDALICDDSNGTNISEDGDGGTPVPTGENPTPTPTPTTISPCDIIQEDFCGYLCQGMDMFGKMYSGPYMNIPDMGSISGTISIPDTGIITNIEIAIDKLTHSHPQDLSMILVPPSGNKILLSSHNKIKNYNPSSGLSFAFSDKALPSIYLNNRNSNDYYLNILDKKQNYKFTLDNINYENFDTSITGLVGYSCSGNWSLIIRDEDIGSSGSISGWHMVITYEPPPYEA